MAQQTFLIPGIVDTRVTVIEDSGALRFTVEALETNGQIADLRGVFFDFNNLGLLSTLSATGSDVNNTAFDAGDVDDLGKGANLKGHITKGGNGFDAGVEIGSQGIGKDDIQTTEFSLASDQGSLSLADIAGVRFGIRYTSVGEQDGPRGESAKIVGINDAPAPQPDTFFVEYGDSITVDVAANDGAFADPSTIMIDQSEVDPALGSATLVNGEVQYTAQTVPYDTLNSSATDSFSYQIANANGDTGETEVTANIVDPLRETATEAALTVNNEQLSLTLSTEDRTLNDSSFVEVNLSAGNLADQNINISFVIDGSGSISTQAYGEQLEAVQDAIDALRADFAGVTGVVDVQLVQFATSTTAENFNLFDVALDDITTGTALSSQLGGLTNYEAALQQAVSFFNSGTNPVEENFLLFTSDGVPTAGGAFTDEVVLLDGLNVSRSAVGFGNAQLSTLNQIDNTNGAELVNDASELSKVFDASPIFPADLIDFSLTLDKNDGNGPQVVADETDLSPAGVGAFVLNMQLLGLENDLSDANVVTATAVWDSDGDLSTTGDQVTLVGQTTIDGTDGSDVLFV